MGRGCRQRVREAVLSLLSPAPWLLLLWGFRTSGTDEAEPPTCSVPRAGFRKLAWCPSPWKVPCPVWLP